MNEPSSVELNELKELISQASKVGDQSTAFAAQRLKVCVSIGEKLNAWKDGIPKGQWRFWLDEHFPELEERSGQRWMRLAEMSKQGTLNLESARGLRHAYQLAGLIPDSDGSATKQSAKGATFTAHIARLVAALQHITLDSLTISERNELRLRLKPVVDLYQKC